MGDDLPGAVSANSWLGYALGASGLLVALLAPVIGQRADATGRRKLSVGVWTALVVACTAALYLVRDDSRWFALGLVLLGLGSIFFELASVSYNALLVGVSTPATIGRVSGFGWAMGYLGGIVLLLAVYLGFIAGDGGLLGVSTADGFNIRLVALVAAGLVRGVRGAAVPAGAGAARRPAAAAPARVARLLPGAARRPALAVPAGPAHRVLPGRQRAVPGRRGRDLRLRRGARGDRLRHRPRATC